MMLATGRMKRTITPTAARGELARRKLAQRDLISFCEYEDPRFIRYRHQVYLGDKLMQVKRFIESGGKEGISRLMILMPPQHGKSTLASIKFPSWLLGKLPDVRIILTSYGADLATRNSKAMRDVVNGSGYQAVFGIKSSAEEPVELSADSRSASRWDLAQPYAGGVLAAGVGGAITGHGADLLVIDDPFKDRKEAESDAQRDDVDDWWKSSASTRLSPSGAVIIFHTRWHPDDLAGRLIQRMANDPSADQWDIVCLPALALDDYPDPARQKQMMLDGVFLPTADPLGRKPGEALLPEKYPADWLISKRASSGTYDFEALYQQMPFLREGGLFKREYFNIVDKIPDGVTLSKFTWYWDKAATPGGGDYSAGVLMAMGSDGMIYVLHAVRGKLSPHDRDNLIISSAQDSIRLWKMTSLKVYHQKDPAAAGKESAQSTNQKLAAAGLTGLFEPVTGDKEDRAGPWQSSLQGGGVRFLRAAWNEPYIEEHLWFPKGKFDDWVDCSSSCHFKVRVAKSKEPGSFQG